MSTSLIALAVAGVNLAALGYKIFRDIKASKTTDEKINVVASEVPGALDKINKLVAHSKKIKSK